ncbi:hypothetical protein KSC_035710 [Ktedonobacter sp. SOSP1-52]|nr:hypothetical protein KSC_035710 [Ktedonobacter sp. SOSP1-52]
MWVKLAWMRNVDTWFSPEIVKGKASITFTLYNLDDKSVSCDLLLWEIDDFPLKVGD